jgi:hypothetical protein
LRHAAWGRPYAKAMGSGGSTARQVEITKRRVLVIMDSPATTSGMTNAADHKIDPIRTRMQRFLSVDKSQTQLDFRL